MTAERLAAVLHRARRLPPGRLAAEAAYRIRRGAAGVVQQARDAVRPTYARAAPCGPLRTYAPALDPRTVAALAPDLADRAARCLEHRFDLLGSGWRAVRHGMACDGFGGHRYPASVPVAPDAGGRWLADEVPRQNLRAARAVWRLIDPAYRSIDWHIDFRSGYRWSPRTWSRRVRYGHRPGVDIKAPWELARMQHLPQLALAFGCAQAGRAGFLPAARYRDEFRHQVLDFVATNPPRYGIHWRSTMEVAIRVANWLLACDLFRRYGAAFDREFDAVFRRSVREHGRHIADHPERTPGWCNNHHLAGLAGLIFVAAYLPPDRETDGWRRAAAEALAGEIERQFLPDGGHFEASTSYHALAAECVTYALALVARRRRADRAAEGAEVGGDSASLPESVSERLGRMAEFVMHLTKPGGRIPQIGDHDSGRLFRLQPRPRLRPTAAGARSLPAGPSPVGPPPLDEEHLAAGHVVAGINGLLRRADLGAWCAGRWLDESLVAGLAGDTRPRPARRPAARSGAERAAAGLGPGFGALQCRLGASAAVERVRVVLAVAGGGPLGEGLSVRAYPDFGVYVWRSRRLFLCLRAGAGPRDGSGGHAHVDQLGLEIAIDGIDWIRDPGSYVYTADPQWRNAYRASAAHFVPYEIEGEADLWRSGPFDLALAAEVRDVGVRASGLAIELDLAGNRIGQIVMIHPHEIIVETKILAVSPAQRLRIRARADRGQERRYRFGRDAVAAAVPFSPGYGLQCADAPGRGTPGAVAGP